MKKLILGLLVLFFALSSCKKYEDGPTISFLSKKSRVVNVWQLDKKFENGKELTLTADDKDDYIEFTKENKVKYTVVSGSTSITVEGTWKFDSNKEYIITEFSFSGVTSIDSLRILRLKSNELWVEEKDGNDVYKYYFVTKK
jgi:hypothetical protein